MPPPAVSVMLVCVQLNIAEGLAEIVAGGALVLLLMVVLVVDVQLATPVAVTE